MKRKRTILTRVKGFAGCPLTDWMTVSSLCGLSVKEARGAMKMAREFSMGNRSFALVNDETEEILEVLD